MVKRRPCGKRRRDMKNTMTRKLVVAMMFVLLVGGTATAQIGSFGIGAGSWNRNSGASGRYLGQYSANRFRSDSTSNRFGGYGSPYSPVSINNPYGRYGSRFSSTSVSNPYATNAPRLYDSRGNYRGRLSVNRYDPDSISNPYGRYGSPYSPVSINNPYGAGSRFDYDSPHNRFGRGLSIYGQY